MDEGSSREMGVDQGSSREVGADQGSLHGLRKCCDWLKLVTTKSRSREDLREFAKKTVARSRRSRSADEEGRNRARVYDRLDQLHEVPIPRSVTKMFR